MIARTGILIRMRMISDMDLEEKRNIPVNPVVSMGFSMVIPRMFDDSPSFSPGVSVFRFTHGGSRRMGRIPALELHPMPMDDGLSASDGGEAKGTKHQKLRFPFTMINVFLYR